MDNDLVDISNENFNEFSEKTKLENSAKWKRRFIHTLSTLKKDSYVSILTESGYTQLLNEVKESLKAQFVNSIQARKLSKLDVYNDRLIARRLSDAEDIRYYMKVDEVFDIIEKVHIESGHRGRDRIKKEVCHKYANITIDMINLFLSMCQTCRLRRVNHKRKFLDDGGDMSSVPEFCRVATGDISNTLIDSGSDAVRDDNTLKQTNNNDNDNNDGDADSVEERLLRLPEQSAVSVGGGSSCGSVNLDADSEEVDEMENNNSVNNVVSENGASITMVEEDEIEDDDDDGGLDGHDGQDEDDDDIAEEEVVLYPDSFKENGLHLISDHDEQDGDGDRDDDNDDDCNDNSNSDEDVSHRSQEDVDDDNDNDDPMECEESALPKESSDNEDQADKQYSINTIDNNETITLGSSSTSMSVTEIKDGVNENTVGIQKTESKSDDTPDTKESTLSTATTAAAATTTMTSSTATTTTTTSITRKPPVEVTTPSRRSLRNVNKRKYEEMADKVMLESRQSAAKSLKMSSNYSDDDIQVIELDGSKAPTTGNTSNKSTIIVNDTKHLARIAAKTGGVKKEPTLVIIDTKSSQSSVQSNRNFSILSRKTSSGSGVSIVSNTKATITPIHTSNNSKMKAHHLQPDILLPSLSDDMFVVEAPSFIVPYVYEKPSDKSLKSVLGDMKKEIDAVLAEKKQKKMEVKDKDKDTKNKNKENDKRKEKAKKYASKNNDADDKRGSSDDNSSSIETASLSSESEEDNYDSDEPLKQNSLIKKSETSTETASSTTKPPLKKSQSESASYFESPIGKFLIKIGFNLVREPVQEDLLRQQRRVKNKTAETEQNIASLMKNIEISKEQNSAFKQELKKCDHCSFKTESILVLLHHMQRPHMRHNMYMCSYCKEETSNPELIIKHITLRHQIQPWLERLPAPFQCPTCPFEDYQRGKLSRHIISCLKRFRIEDNLAPPLDWEPPAKIPRLPRSKPTGLAGDASSYQYMTQRNKMHQQQQQQQQHHNLFQNHHPHAHPHQQRHAMVPGALPLTALQQKNRSKLLSVGGTNNVNSAQNFARVSNMMSSITATKTILPKSLNLNAQSTSHNNKALHHPSISITPLPRQGNVANSRPNQGASSGDNNATSSGGNKPTFVICEICDGYIKDLEMLRNHMQWIHKVKIHPKMIYNRPPLNCQKCQFRFFTDQGLERHLLGSHGLVTSSMQEAANKGKDGGRCPICGKVYQCKLLNHVSKEHHTTLKPAHLSYKCTVCTATFGMYKQFENHVYSAHSMVAKKLMDKKGPASANSSGIAASTTAAPSSSSTPNKSGITATPSGSSSSLSISSNDSLKPLKINDEITIIPQPVKK